MPNFEDDSGNCHAPDPNGVACYKSRIGCPIHPRQKRKRRECSELSALRLNNDRLRADNERLRADLALEGSRIGLQRREIEKMRAENEKMRAALLWYADSRNHFPVEHRNPGDPDPAVIFLEEPPIMSDGGERAREALEGEA